MWSDVVITGVSAFLDPISHVILRSILRKPLVVHYLNLPYVDTTAYRHTYVFNSIRGLNLSGSKIHPGILTSSHLTALDVSSTNVRAEMLTQLGSLTKLCLDRVRLNNVEFLIQFRETLTELSLVNITCDLTPLRALTELKNLSVSVTDLAFVRELTQLTSIQLTSFGTFYYRPNCIDVAPLYHLPLQSITIDVKISVEAAEQLATIPTLTKWDVTLVKIPDQIFSNPRLEKLGGLIDKIPVIVSQVLTIAKLRISEDVPHLQFLPPSVTTLICDGYDASISLTGLPPYLTRLEIYIPRISRDDLMALQDLPLTCLRLIHTTIHTLEFIQRMPLHTLVVFTDRFQQHLHNSELMYLKTVRSTLTHLDLTNNQITDEGLQHITGIPLTYLDLANTAFITCSPFLCMPLQELNLTGMRYFIESDVTFNLDTIPWGAIGSIPTLKVLHFGNNNSVNDNHVNQLRDARLTRLFVHGTLTDACVDTLLKMPLLTLTVRDFQLSEGMLTQLQRKLVTFTYR